MDVIARAPLRSAWLFAACLTGLWARTGWGCVTDLECASLGFRCRGPGQCSNGDCIYPNPLDCNDSDPCTMDRCDDNFGCLHDPYCPADASVCNGTETCAVVIISIAPPRKGPRCGQSNVPTCDDGKACTIDSCRDPSGCGHTPLNCDDGNLCTVDACAEPGGCSHTPRDCDDGDPCTADDCLRGNGCRHVPITPCCESVTDCPDLVCAVERQCVANGCTAGTPRDCDDGDPATTDSCDPGQGGCVHVPLPDGGGPAGCVDAGDCPPPADTCTVAACPDGRCAEQSVGGLAGLTCTCSRPTPTVCVGQTAPRQVSRAAKRACRIIGRVPGATGPRAGKLIRRAGKQFGRAQRAALGALTRRKATLTAGCAEALGAVYADGVTRAKRLEEQR